MKKLKFLIFFNYWYRESGLRNADLPKPKKLKTERRVSSPTKKSVETGDNVSSDKNLEETYPEKMPCKGPNVENARLRVESKSKGFPRIDRRQTTAEDLRTVFVGNVSLTTDKKVAYDFYIDVELPIKLLHLYEFVDARYILDSVVEADGGIQTLRRDRVCPSALCGMSNKPVLLHSVF